MHYPKLARILATALVVCGSAQKALAVVTFDEVKARYRSSQTVLLDRNGVVIQSLRTDPVQRRLDWVALADVSPALREAIVYSEDRRFYAHGGIDWKAVGAAALTNAWSTHARGASTLTMQLAGLLDSDLRATRNGRSFSNKLRQAAFALQIDRDWKKDQILEAYLNLVTFRGEITGVGALSATLFDKYPSGLDWREASLAAALVRAPNAAAPAVAARACSILRGEGWGEECVGLSEFASDVLGRKSAARLDPATDLAPHLAHHLMAQTSEARIATTLDATLQRHVQSTLKQQLAELNQRHVADGAVIVLDNASGAVLAWVGSSGARSSAPEVDGVLAPRQAGSTLKPFLYELALEKRWLTAASLLDDAPLDLAVGAGLYVPQDYEKDFKGPVSLRTALASSLNVPAVRTLVMMTPERFYERLVQLGFRLRETGDYYGYSLALGSPEVDLATLANAYRTLARGGRFSPWHARESDRFSPGVALLDPRASFIVTDILSDRNARALTFGMDNLLNTPFFSAAKTGTSKDMRDNWCIGYSHRYTVGVWVGNASGAPMWDVSGVSGAAPIWRSVMQFLEENDGDLQRAQSPVPPAGVVLARVRFPEGLEASREEWFLEGTAQTEMALANTEQVARSRIASPTDGTIVALDPDIPARAQRLRFRTVAQAAQSGSWRLDGRILGHAGPLDWALWPGRHVLELVSAQGAVLDRVQFEVRGAQLRAEPRPSSKPGLTRPVSLRLAGESEDALP